MAPVKANTWPPLISGSSSDDAGKHQLYGQEVLSSTLFEAESSDGFFYPVECAHTGFAYDGTRYQNGAVVPESDKATWYLEPPGPCRGGSPAFPQKGAILLTDAGLSILDVNDRWSLWMTFLRGDTLAFTHNALGSVSGFTPQSVTYRSGKVLVGMGPDPGSDFKAPITLVFDLALDSIYMDRPAYKAPLPGPYSTPVATLHVGSGSGTNTPSLDLTEGGAATFWDVYPTLPGGLSLNPDTGVITGTPTELSPLTTYVVTAYNPGGFGQTSVSIEVQEKVGFLAEWNRRRGFASTWYILG